MGKSKQDTATAVLTQPSIPEMEVPRFSGKHRYIIVSLIVLLIVMTIVRYPDEIVQLISRGLEGIVIFMVRLSGWLVGQGW